MAKHNDVGATGENIATAYLADRGYSILERNYTRKWGEIDIIARKGQKIHFVEVKTTSRLPAGQAGETKWEVSRENEEYYRPEENVHPQKLKRLVRAIETYIAEKEYEGEWQLDVLTVELFIKDKKAVCGLLENVL